ncbi:MAG: hypothetical protein M2R45_03442 [Verrucomicrobia subdivision 3 bacterium]|nr:hypothetical protein [Limisphaerales bacterium]MCS1415740.1 hypothetical protein [Limisphaerales bacterium]
MQWIVERYLSAIRSYGKNCYRHLEEQFLRVEAVWVVHPVVG